MADFPTFTEAARLPQAPAWAANTAYGVGRLVWQGTTLYRCKTAHTSGASFSATNWDQVTGSGGSGGATASWAGWQTMSGGYGDVGGPNGDGFGVGRNAYVLPESGTSSVFISHVVPPGWATMAIDMYCYLPSGSTGGGQFALRLSYAVDGDGSNVGTSPASSGSSANFAAPTTAQIMTVTTLVASAAVPSSGGAFNAFMERSPASAGDTSTADLRVHGLMLRKLT